MTLSPKQLWAASAVAWSGTAAVAAAGLPEDAYTAVLGVALMTLLAAIQSVAITRRLDRQYAAMIQAATRLRNSGPAPAPEAEGVVVSLRDTARAARGASGE